MYVYAFWKKEKKEKQKQKQKHQSYNKCSHTFLTSFFGLEVVVGFFFFFFCMNSLILFDQCCVHTVIIPWCWRRPKIKDTTFVLVKFSLHLHPTRTGTREDIFQLTHDFHFWAQRQNVHFMHNIELKKTVSTIWHTINETLSCSIQYSSFQATHCILTGIFKLHMWSLHQPL